MKKLITNDFQVVYTKIQTIKKQKNFKDNKNRNFGKKIDKNSLALDWVGLEHPNLAIIFVNL